MIRNFVIRALSVLSIVSLSLTSALPAHAENKPDPKVAKECEAINETYDGMAYGLILRLPLGAKNRDIAQREVNEGKASPDILLECGALDSKTWKSIKNDYSKVVKSANITIKMIIKKYNLIPDKTITCMKNGLKKEVTSTNPKCPRGYKKLY